jgi:hypothetical protein
MLKLTRVSAPPVPYKAIASLPHLEIVSADDLPVSGSAAPKGGHHVIFQA